MINRRPGETLSVSFQVSGSRRAAIAGSISTAADEGGDGYGKRPVTNSYSITPRLYRSDAPWGVTACPITTR